MPGVQDQSGEPSHHILVRLPIRMFIIFNLKLISPLITSLRHLYFDLRRIGIKDTEMIVVHLEGVYVEVEMPTKAHGSL